MLERDLQYEEEPTTVLDNYLCMLSTKEIMSMKVQWKHRPVEEATLEIEQDMQDKYP